MNKKLKPTRWRTLLLLAATGLGVALIVQAMPWTFATNSPAFSGLGLAQEGPRSCCIAGKYSGTRKDTRSATCPEPTTENFTMEISQGKKCEADILGTIVGDSDPSHIQNFTGTVTQSATRGCCDIKGGFSETGGKTEFQGTLCRKGNKWSGSGTYKSTRERFVCSGTWKMSQI
jgi:hypothetical protein